MANLRMLVLKCQVFIGVLVKRGKARLVFE
ncbi:hypothetical protein SME36J_13200 [Serratia marcescens]|nr:hypothetical protein SME06J_13830 [Serratia marcescens]BEM42895.1 hypothetical protein SME13J_15140 [Serratia marcescens]BEM71897.1 hypothetical protein SME36J_13200 [Serratia marcescens]